MTFITAFLWGTGLSLGMCVGLIVWSRLRPWITDEPDYASVRAFNKATLLALEERNRLTGSQVNALDRIAIAAEKC